MKLLKSIAAALSAYTIIPMPAVEWDSRCMKYAICFLPLAGVLCGGLVFAWYLLCRVVEAGGLFFAAAAVCIPVILTGGIHLDGYMDTVDALASHQPSDVKLKILKDSHCGAFAVIYCIVYFLLNTVLFYELYRLNSVAVFCPVYVLSRALSAVCVVDMPKAGKSGMLRTYTENAAAGTANISMTAVAALSIALMLWISPLSGGISAGCAAVSVLLYCKTARKHFGGVTGDTAGFFLQSCELLCMAGVWIGAVIK